MKVSQTKQKVKTGKQEINPMCDGMNWMDFSPPFYMHIRVHLPSWLKAVILFFLSQVKLVE
jgi:hypothetical protein